MSKERSIVLAVAMLALAAPALAQGIDLGGHDSGAPISVSANSAVGDIDSKGGVYKGNVIVSQGNFKLHADKVRIASVRGDVDTVTAVGHVLFDAPSGQAKGEKAVYKLKPRVVTLTGDVVLTKNKNVMRGTQLVIDLATGKAALTAQGLPGNRVQALFEPPKKQSGKPKSAKPK